MGNPLHPGALAALLLLTPGAVQAQAPDLTKELKNLQSMVKDRKMAEDFLAISLIDRLSADPAKLTAKDQAKVAKGLAKVYRTGRLRPPDRLHLYQETADAMAKFGKNGSTLLLKAIETERIKGREYAGLRAYMIRALGRAKDEKQIDWLTKQALRSPDNAVMAAAGEALGNFTKMPLKTRRKLVKSLVGRLGELHMQSTALESSDPKAPIDLGPQNARRTLGQIRRPWNATLTTLTGQKFSTAAQWQRWLNKNRNWKPPA